MGGPKEKQGLGTLFPLSQSGLPSMHIRLE
jgi:hypothetical protein